MAWPEVFKWKGEEVFDVIAEDSKKQLNSQLIGGENNQLITVN